MRSGTGPQMAPGEPAVEQDAFGEVVLAGRLRIWEHELAHKNEGRLQARIQRMLARG